MLTLSNKVNNFILFFLLSIAWAFPVHAEDQLIKNAGFVQGNIWYSKTPFFAGDKIRIYTIVFNGSTQDLTGSVEFLDNGIPIGESQFAISGGGRVRDMWVDWIAKDGKHTITARIAEVSATDTSGKKKIVALESGETGKSEVSVDFDTDGDGIGNMNDTDDDNDGVSDVDEIKNGTDPLKQDTDGNGITDGKELELIAKKVLDAKNSSMTTSTVALGQVETAIKMANDAIPATLKAGVSSSTNAIERFRVGEGYQFRLDKEAKIKEIDAIKEREKILVENNSIKSATVDKNKSTLDTISSMAEKPFAYVMFAVFALLQYLFEWKVVFYGVILYVLYRIFKWIIRRIRYG